MIGISARPLVSRSACNADAGSRRAGCRPAPFSQRPRIKTASYTSPASAVVDRKVRNFNISPSGRHRIDSARGLCLAALPTKTAREVAVMPTYEIRISQGSNASNFVVDLPNEAMARDEVIAIFGDLARDFARELPQDPWNIEILDPARRRVLKLTAHAELGSAPAYRRSSSSECTQT
jgi:hypothetical protein